MTESRKWKEAVARETEGMTHKQLLAYFDREMTLERMRLARERVARSEPASC